MIPPTALTRQRDRPQQILGDPYLKFDLGNHTHAVIPMKQVQEVLNLSLSRLTAMPNLPACVLGLMNRRSSVLWVLDLRSLLDLGTINLRQCNVMIVRKGNALLGIAVPTVEGMTWLSADMIQPTPAHAAAHLLPYLRGCVVQDADPLLVLDTDAIWHSSAVYRA